MFAPMRGASKEIAVVAAIKAAGNYAPRLMPIMERLPPSSWRHTDTICVSIRCGREWHPLPVMEHGKEHGKTRS